MSTSKDLDMMQASIDTLEVKLAYQEHTIDTLNEEITRQQKDIDTLTQKLQLLTEKFKSLQVSNIAGASEETPPPHY